MRNEVYEDITGSLIHTYGSFQIYTLMESVRKGWIAETDEHHLIVLVDDQDEVIQAIWHYDSRVDLPWIVYAVKQHLPLLEYQIKQANSRLNWLSQPNYMARLEEHVARRNAEQQYAENRRFYQSADQIVTRSREANEYQRTYYTNILHALQRALKEVETVHPEGIPDVSAQAMAEHEQQMQRIEDGRRKAEAWRHYIGKGITDWHQMLGPQVIQVGPFHVYQSLGRVDRLDSPPSVYISESGVSYTNPGYMILFEDDALGVFDIWITAYHYIPGPHAICRPARSWFCGLSESIDEAAKALSEATDPDEAWRIQESLAWRKKIYLTVYDAWVALGCPSVPDDDSDPAFDPTTAAVFGTDRSDDEELR